MLSLQALIKAAHFMRIGDISISNLNKHQEKNNATDGVFEGKYLLTMASRGRNVRQCPEAPPPLPEHNSAKWRVRFIYIQRARSLRRISTICAAVGRASGSIRVHSLNSLTATGGASEGSRSACAPTI
jgi:hypothetical protein